MRPMTWGEAFEELAQQTAPVEEEIEREQYLADKEPQDMSWEEYRAFVRSALFREAEEEKRARDVSQFLFD